LQRPNKLLHTKQLALMSHILYLYVLYHRNKRAAYMNDILIEELNTSN